MQNCTKTQWVSVMGSFLLGSLEILKFEFQVFRGSGPVFVSGPVSARGSKVVDTIEERDHSLFSLDRSHQQGSVGVKLTPTPIFEK